MLWVIRSINDTGNCAGPTFQYFTSSLTASPSFLTSSTMLTLTFLVLCEATFIHMSIVMIFMFHIYVVNVYWLVHKFYLLNYLFYLFLVFSSWTCSCWHEHVVRSLHSVCSTVRTGVVLLSLLQHHVGRYVSTDVVITYLCLVGLSMLILRYTWGLYLVSYFANCVCCVFDCNMSLIMFRTVCFLVVLAYVQLSCSCLVEFSLFALTCHMISTLYLLLCILFTFKLKVLCWVLLLWHVGMSVTWTCWPTLKMHVGFLLILHVCIHMPYKYLTMVFAIQSHRHTHFKCM